MATHIKCGQLFRAQDESVLKDMVIVVEENKIVKVAPAAECAPAADDKVIDLSGKFVMPGLIDAHLHLTMSGEPDSTDTNYHKGVGELAIISMLNAQADLLAGFTTVRDAGSPYFLDVDLRKMIDSGKVWGPRLFCSGVCLSSTGGHGDTHFRPGIEVESGMSIIVNSPDECRAAARKVIKHGADQIKLMATGGVLSMGDDPGAPELTVEEMKTIVDLANSHGKLTAAHAHGGGGIKNAIKAGVVSIEHGTTIDDEGVEMLAASESYLIPTIIAGHLIKEYGVENGIPAWAVEKTYQVLTDFGSKLEKLRGLGAKIGFGTDCATPFNTHGNQTREFKLMCDYGKFRPAETLLCATKVNSELLRWNDRIGSIDEGKFADIIAFDNSPLDDITEMTRCTFVMKDGVVYKG
ncbi:MAG: amidohydrolase family protein [Clostridia bacterium]|nr:amidohydrolase family protein [Clostridia bacterium]